MERRQELENAYKEWARRVKDLRAFERDYRSRLIESLESQLRELRAGAAPDDQQDTP